jgi:hypothetical protein
MIPVDHYNNAVDALIIAHEANEQLQLWWNTKDKRHLYEYTRLRQNFNKLFRQFTFENKQLVTPDVKAKAA